MNIAGINYESINDGEGVRTVIYVSGCSHKCPNCHNQQTHDANYGVKLTDELQEDIINNIKKRPFISGVTFSGGDPLYNKNVYDVYNFIQNLKVQFPDKSIWLYTGYTWEQIFYPIVIDDFNLKIDKITDCRRSIVEMCDVLVDGRYIEEEKDLTLKFTGSRNQMVINVQKTIETGEIVLWQ